MTFVTLLVLVNSGQREFWNYFGTKNVTHWERFMLCTFVVVNGLNPKISLDWIDVIGMARDKHSVREFKSLLDTFINNPDKWTQSLWL